MATRRAIRRIDGARAIHGVALLCGIGLTMSLFIGLLAVSDAEGMVMIKLAVLTGSILSALAGAAVLMGLPPAPNRHETSPS
jgi:Na+/H+ antiporter NhaA